MIHKKTRDFTTESKIYKKTFAFGLETAKKMDYGKKRKGGFVVFSQQLLIGCMGQVNVNDCPAG